MGETNHHKNMPQDLLPQLRLLSNSDMAELLSLPSPKEVTKCEGFTRTWEFDAVDFNEQQQVTAVHRKGEQLRLAQPVDTEGVSTSQWLQALDGEVSATLRRLFLEASANPCMPLAELAMIYPCCTAVLVQMVRFTTLMEAG